MNKKSLFGLFAMGTLLFAASCQEEDVVKQAQENTLATVSINVTTPEMGVATRAFGDGTTAMDLHYAVYNVKTNTNGEEELTYLSELTEEDHAINITTTVDLQLVTGNTYKVIFWADNENAPYTLNWNATDENGAAAPTMTINYDGVTSNNENYDAFCNWMTINVDGSKTVDIDLFRPFAQLNIGTNDIVEASKAGYTLKQTQVKVKAYKTLNFWGMAVDDANDDNRKMAAMTVADETEVVFNLADYPNYDANADHGLMASTADGYEKFPVTGYEYMAMNYLLRPYDKDMIDVEFTFLSDANEQKERKYTYVPLQRNWRTNIYGQLITSDVDVNVEIIPAFDGAHNREVWDGHTLTKPQIFGNEVHVYQGSELAYVANKINGGGQSNAEQNGTRSGDEDVFNYLNADIKLMQNIDLGGENWTPIKEFKGTFDGWDEEKQENFVISNLYVSTEKDASAGLFASVQGTIQNLTVIDAKIYGHYKAGIIAGNSLCGDFINCHVDASDPANPNIVLSTPHKKTDGYDDANNVGGIVGYLCADGGAASIKSCSAKNTVITGFRDVAGITGHANATDKNIVEVSGNKVENVTITADQTAEYVSNEKDGNAGAIVGRIHAKAKIENNAVGENVTVIRKVDSTKEMEYAVADAQDGDIIYVGDGEVALPHFTDKALKFIGIHENAAIAEPVSSHIDEFWKGSSLSFENLKIKGTSYTGKANGYVKSAKEEYTNCKFVDGYYMFAGDVTTVTDGLFTGKTNSYFWTGSADDITFTNCQFNGVERSVKVCTVGHTGVERKVTFNGCSFTATEKEKAAIEIDGTKGSSYIVNINNCKETGFNAGNFTGMPMFNIVEDAEKNTVDVYVDGRKWEGNGTMTDEAGNLHVYSVAAIKASVEVEGATVYVYPNPNTEDGTYDIESKLSLAKGVRLIGAGEEPVKIKNTWSSNLFANQAHFTDTYMENIVCDNNLVIDAGIANGNVVFKKCVFGGELAHQSVHFDSGNGTITFEECTFIGRNMLGSSIEKVTFNKCYFENKRSSLTGADKWTGVNMWGKYEFNECVFGTEAHCSVKCDGVVAAFNNCKFDDNRDITSLINYDGEFDANITFDGNKYVAEGLLEDAEGNQVAYSEAGLKEALGNGGTVVLANPFTIDQSETNGYGKTGINMTNGGTLDGNGNELGAPGSTGTWDSAINTSGGTIKNLKVTKGFRGIFIKKDSKHNEKLFLENVTIDGTTYTISCDSGNGLGLEATNSTFKGWTSYAATLGNAKFTDCYFGKGSGYAYCRPYAPTEFVGCAFEAGFTVDPRADVTFENCTLGGVALTAENLADLVTNTAKATIK